MNRREVSALIASRGDLDEQERAEVAARMQAAEDSASFGSDGLLLMAVVLVVAIIAALACIDFMAFGSAAAFAGAVICTRRDRQDTGFDEREGLHRIDTDAMLASGVIEGPFRPTHPVTVTRWMRVRRWWAVAMRRAAGF